MKRRRLLQLSGAALIGLSGCFGSTTEPADTDTDTNTDTDTETEPTATVTDTATASTPQETETTTRTPRDSTVVQYDDLTGLQQAAFDDAMSAESVTLWDGLPDAEYPYLDVAGPFRDHEYVLKNDTYYRVEIDGPELSGRSGQRITVEQIDAPETESVVDLDEESSSPSELLTEAFETGSAEGEGSIGSYEQGAVLKYQDAYYRIDSIQHVDYGKAELIVEERSD